MKYAHYYGSKSKGFELIINESIRPIGGLIFKVTGKAEAKKLSKLHGATPWNF